MPPSRTANILLAILATILGGWVLHAGAGILQPLVIALLLASMLQPVVSGLKRWRIPPAVTIVFLVTLLFFGLARIGILLQANLESFAGETPTVEGVEGLDPLSDRQAELVEDLGGWEGVKAAIIARMESSALPEPLVGYLSELIVKIDAQGLASGLIGGGFGFTKSLLLVMIYMIFIFAEQAVFRNKILAVAGDKHADAAEVLDTIGRGIQRYLGVKTLVSLVTGALCYAVLVALQIPYALLFGLLTFLLNYIPTFGSIIAGAFPTITALAVESTWTKALVVVVCYLAVNMVMGYILEPRLLSRELNLSPLVIIISVVVWAGLWGVVGAFLAVPLTSAMQIVLASQEKTRPIAVMLSSGPPREVRRKASAGEATPRESRSDAGRAA